MTQTTPSHSQAVEAAVQRLFALASHYRHAAWQDAGWHEKKLLDALRAELTSRQEVAAPVGEFDDWPDFNEQAMGCGLEDRNITDRYEAMRYGWDEAMERVGERFEQFLAASRVPVASLAEPEGDVQLRACDQTTGREYFIKKGPRSAMQAEADAMNEKGRDYFVTPSLPATHPMAVGAVGGVGARIVVQAHKLLTELDDYFKRTKTLDVNVAYRCDKLERALNATPAPEQADTGSGDSLKSAFDEGYQFGHRDGMEDCRPMGGSGYGLASCWEDSETRFAILSTASPAGEVKS